MYIADHARVRPDHPALIDGGADEVLTYRELDQRSNRLANLLCAHGLRRGDHIALFLENNMRFMEVCWAALRLSLYYTTINRYLTAEETAYIVNDCGAQALVTSLARGDVAVALPPLISNNCRLRLMVDGVVEGWASSEAAVALQPENPLYEDWLGEAMLYSSGTTGRPKGIERKLRDLRIGDEAVVVQTVLDYGFNRDTVYTSRRQFIIPHHSSSRCGCSVSRRNGGDDGTLRCAGGVAAHRTLPRDPQPMGANDVRADAQTAACRADSV